MAKYAMVIDLHRCTGCGGCIIACKNENNLSQGVSWASKISWTVGTFPNVRFTYVPTLCNHCENAPCVSACPTTAMYKTDDGITMLDSDKCIGCRYCIAACPYGVIHFNAEDPQAFWKEEQALMEGTASAVEVTRQVGATVMPYYNPEREVTLPGVRPKGTVEKCTFCDHRVSVGQLPYCVEACPANARVFGDLDDPSSTVSKLLSKYQPIRLREALGTEPKVSYIRSYHPGTYKMTKGELG